MMTLNCQQQVIWKLEKKNIKIISWRQITREWCIYSERMLKLFVLFRYLKYVEVGLVLIDSKVYEGSLRQRGEGANA